MPAVAGAPAGTGAAASALSISAMTVPSEASSPTFSLSSRTTPANGAGTSMVALSDSSVTSPWSLATVSPTFTSTSITGTFSLPMSGTRASRTPPDAAGAGAADGGGAVPVSGGASSTGGCDGAGAGRGAASRVEPVAASASIVAIRWPSATSSPTLTLTSRTVPANGAGTSMVALSDSSVIRLCSFSTRSPALIITSITGTWSLPMSGTRASLRSAMGSPAYGGPRGWGRRQDLHHNQRVRHRACPHSGRLRTGPAA